MPAKKKAATKTKSVAKQIIGSAKGVKITLDDARGKTLTLETPGGHKITLSDTPMVIDITDSSGNSIKLDPGGITIRASAKVTVQASEVKVTAGAINVDAALAKFSGTVQCDTLVTNSVVSSSYTPGAGNIW